MGLESDRQQRMAEREGVTSSGPRRLPASKQKGQNVRRGVKDKAPPNLRRFHRPR